MGRKTINGRYEVVRELGHGGMGCVYLVEDLHRNRLQLALKTILPGSAGMKNLERFRVEFASLSLLRHPNIAAAFDFGRITGTEECFFTTEYVEGVDVYRATEGASTEQIVDVITQTLRGLDFIHSHGFLHNDLKPANILIETPGAAVGAAGSLGRVKFIDFGLFTTEHTSWLDLLGTPQFLSPERIRGLPTDRRSDLYALGFILYLLCSRKYPFDTSDAETLLGMHLDATVPGLAAQRPDLPPALLQLVERLMKKRPTDRFQSAAATLKFVEENLVSWTGSAPPSPDLVSGNLVERESELIYLEECFCTISALASESPCVVVLGPSGIGKTRLVRELNGLVQVSGGAFIEVSCASGGNDLQPAARAILSSLETSGVGGLAELRAALTEGADRVTPGEASAPEGLSILLQSAVLQNSREMPLLVFFDDFHAASSALQRFALGLARAARERLKAGASRPKLLVVIASRTGENENARPGKNAAIPGADEFPVVHLQPLSDHAARSFVKHVFAQEDFPDAMLSSVVGRARGNPGRLLELSRSLVDERCVRHSGSRWVPQA
jgi:serine/threonine protein kinase